MGGLIVLAIVAYVGLCVLAVRKAKQRERAKNKKKFEEAQAAKLAEAQGQMFGKHDAPPGLVPMPSAGMIAHIGSPGAPHHGPAPHGVHAPGQGGMVKSQSFVGSQV